MKPLLLSATLFLSLALIVRAADTGDASPSPSPTPKSGKTAKATATPKSSSPKGSPKASASPKSSASPKGKASPSPEAASSPDKSGLPEIVAKVDGENIKRAELEDELNARLAMSGHTLDSLTPDVVQQAYRSILQKMVVDRLLRKRSADVKVTDEELTKGVQMFKQEQQFDGTDAELDAELKKHGQSLDILKDKVIRVQVQKEKWIESQIADKDAVTDDEAKSFYDKNPEKFLEPKSVRVSHILILVPEDATPEVDADKKKKAQEAKDRITKGEDFAKVAGDVSEDPRSKSKGGDLVQYIQEGSMKDSLPQFEDAAFKLKKGEVSDPVKTRLGWHIIKVTDIKDPQTISYAEAKDTIVEALKEEKADKAAGELLKGLMDKNVTILLPPLKAAAPDEMGMHGQLPPSPDQGGPASSGGPSSGPAPGGDSAPDSQPPTDRKPGDDQMPGGQ